MTARQYQLDCLSAFDFGWSKFRKQLGILPTGSGKTIIFSWMSRAVVDQGERVLVLVDQSELAFQTVDKMRRAADLKCEVEKAELTARRSAQVVVSTVQTMSCRLDDWPQEHFGLIICDEADKSISDQWQKVLSHFTAKKIAGFTATPNRTDKKNLGTFYENIAYQISLGELINQGYLSRIVIKQLPIRISLEKVHVTQGDFDKNDLADAITPHLTECAQAIRQHASFRKTLVFVPLIATSLKFVEICRAAGLSAEHIDATSEDRAQKLIRFERGEFDILVNSQLLLRGIDIPPIDCVFVLRPTKSITLYQQAVGRGTRLSEFKENLLILDPFYEADKRLICRPAHLIAGTEEEATSITAAATEAAGEQLTALDLLGMSSVAQAQRERALRKKLEDHQDRSARTISAEEFAVRNNKLEVAEYEPTMKWEFEPVSKKQIKYLTQAGIDINTVLGKGHASQLLSIHFGKKPLELASPSAIALMCRLRHIAASIGITSPEHATAGEQRRFFAELNKRKQKQKA
jgi:type I site-specific restriction endonuclease